MIPVVSREVREVPIDRIDDPEFLMRERFDTEKYAELRDDIAANGIQQALIVERRGDRFRLCAGFRRLTVARELGAETVPCDIREPGALDEEAIKILENDIRENTNAADAALYLKRLFVSRCGNDVDKLCELVKRSRKYVDDRLRLTLGDEEVFQALLNRKISFSVARELNGIRDTGYRHVYLDDAVKFGMTGGAAAEKRRTANRAVEMGAAASDTSSSALQALAQGRVSDQVCHVCRRSDRAERLRWIIVHDHCDLAILEPLLAPFRQANAGAADGGAPNGES